MQDLHPLKSCATLLILGMILISGCKTNPSSTEADIAAVRQTDENWSKAAQTKKVEDWMAFYADDAVILPPNDVKASDREHIRKVIATMLNLPGLAVSFAAQKVDVARSGDLAYTQGAYDLSFIDPHGKPTVEHGKTVEVWRKQADGSWKCVADIWSSNAPAPAA